MEQNDINPRILTNRELVKFATQKLNDLEVNTLPTTWQRELLDRFEAVINQLTDVVNK